MKRKRVTVEEESTSYFAALLAHSEERVDVNRDDPENESRSRDDNDTQSQENIQDQEDEGSEHDPDETERAREAFFEDLERRRQARLQALNEQVAASLETGSTDNTNSTETWGGSDEEPDEDQTEFMRRTASHIASSPNPTQLEMRILANHGSDPRFAFLKGRWARAWRDVQVRSRMQKENEGKVARSSNSTDIPSTLTGLDAYGSDEE